MEQNALTELPPEAFSGLSSLKRLYLDYNDLADLPPAVFVGLSTLKRLWLGDNPGAPFPLVAEPVRTDSEDLRAPAPARVAVTVMEGAPFTMKVGLRVREGTSSADVVTIDAGGMRSGTVSVTPDTVSPVSVSINSVPALPFDPDCASDTVINDFHFRGSPPGGDRSFSDRLLGRQFQEVTLRMSAAESGLFRDFGFHNESGVRDSIGFGSKPDSSLICFSGFDLVGGDSLVLWPK